MKYDNLARSLAMMEAELERAGERVKNAESKVVVIEDELGSIGENQKQLEISEEKARKREEKYQDQIKQIHWRKPEAAGDLRGEGEEAGGEVPGPDQADPLEKTRSSWRSPRRRRGSGRRSTRTRSSRSIGENQKQLEISEEKARKREEKYQDQ